MTQADAEQLGLQAFVFVAENPEYMEAFCAQSGLDPADAASRPRDTALLCGVLQFLLEVESYVSAFCETQDIAPEQPARALEVLSHYG